MGSPILVTGGTGNLGGHVVPLLRAAGREVRVLSRHAREPGDGLAYLASDLLAGDGLAEALDGVETIVHLAGGPKGDDVATRNLVAAAEESGAAHLVYIGVIAADKVPLGYFRSKLGAERAIEDSGIPHTTLRAAQFHDFALALVRAVAKSPIAPVPGMRLQPVDVREVAARLADLALDAPAGRVRDLAGPRVHTVGELLDGYLRAAGKRRVRLPIRVPGKAGRVYRAGENLVLDGADRGKRTWAEFLAERETS